MKLRFLAALVLLSTSAFAQVGPVPGGGGSGTIVAGTAAPTCSINSLVYINSSGNIACARAPQNGNTTTAATATNNWLETITGASATSNWYNITGTFPGTLSAETSAVLLSITGDNDAQTQSALKSSLVLTADNPTAGGAVYGTLTGGAFSGTSGFFANSNTSANNYGVVGQTTGVGARAYAVGGFSTGINTTTSYGGFFSANGGSAISTGVSAVGDSDATAANGIFATLATAPTLYGASPGATSFSALNGKIVGLFENKAIAADIIVASDNSAVLPVGSATATWSVRDGAFPQFGLGVLTTATMTASTQAYQITSTSSYAWTNAMVVALGGALTGDITVATLPAKTQINNAYVVIDTAAGGPATLSVSCGDAIGGTPFINYIVASDAKAAANTVYGDAAAERGTSIDTEFYYVPSYTATTLVSCHFIATVSNLNTTTTSTGRVILTTTLLP